MICFHFITNVRYAGAGSALAPYEVSVYEACKEVPRLLA